jgi:hypothetical protein
MAIVDRRGILGYLSMSELRGIAQGFELIPKDDGSRDGLLDLLSSSGVPLGEMLMRLSRPRLRELCRHRGTEPTGREKVILVAQVLGVDPFAPPRPRAVPPIRRMRDKPPQGT